MINKQSHINAPFMNIQDFINSVDIGEDRDAMHGALKAVLEERTRQDKKWGEQNHCMEDWMLILHEETGELSEAILHEKFGGHAAEELEKEAVQIAAVALQIVQFLKRRPRAAWVRDKK